jgi:hypothetical protein
MPKVANLLASVGHLLDLIQLTVCSVVEEKNIIKEHVWNAGNMLLKTMSKRKGVVMEEMEKLL